jgi:hypothetical protein
VVKKGGGKRHRQSLRNKRIRDLVSVAATLIRYVQILDACVAELVATKKE